MMGVQRSLTLTVPSCLLQTKEWFIHFPGHTAPGRGKAEITLVGL